MKKIIALIIGLFSCPGFAAESHQPTEFQALFRNWTQAFNQKQFPKVCELFSSEIVSDYQGAPQKTYFPLCNGFKKIFSDKNVRYHNDFKIHTINQSGDLATVRITWYLTIEHAGKKPSFIQEEGLDVLKQQPDHSWKIVNFLAYPILQKNATKK